MSGIAGMVLSLGMAVADKKIIEVAINELTAITGQKAVVQGVKNVQKNAEGKFPTGK